MAKNLYFVCIGGPTRDSSEQILSCLSRVRVKATFFLSLKQGFFHAGTNSLIPVLKKIAEQGHAVGLSPYASSNAKQFISECEEYMPKYTKLIKDRGINVAKEFDSVAVPYQMDSDNLAMIRKNLGLSIVKPNIFLGNYVKKQHFQDWLGVDRIYANINTQPKSGDILAINDADWQGKGTELKAILTHLKENDFIFQSLTKDVLANNVNVQSA